MNEALQDNRFMVYLRRVEERLRREQDAVWTKWADESAQLRGELEQPLKIVVTGIYNAGKSTFINALLQTEVMPTNVKRETLTQNWLLYEERHGLKIHFRDRKSEYIPCAENQLGDKLREKTREQADRIDHVRIYYPLKWLKHFTIIDTPGFDFDKRDDQIAYRILEQSDLLIWLICGEKFGKSEHKDLTRLLHDADKQRLEQWRTDGQGELMTLGLINYIDTMEESDVRQVRERLEGFRLFDRVYPISAKLAVKAKDKNDADKDYFHSGFSNVRNWLDDEVFEKHQSWQFKKIRRQTRRFRNRIAKALTVKITEKGGDRNLSELKKELDGYGVTLTLGDGAMKEIIEPIRQADLDKIRTNYRQRMDVLGFSRRYNITPKIYKKFSTNPFKDSYRIKKQILTILEYVRDLVHLNEHMRGQPNSMRKRNLIENIERLKNTVFTIGVFGGFSSGKSTFLNVLLGTDLLPVDEDRCTSVQTILRKNSQEHPPNTLSIDWKKKKDIEQELRYYLGAFGLQNESFDTEKQSKELIEKLKAHRNRELDDAQRDAKQQAMELLKPYPHYEQIKKQYSNAMDVDKTKVLVQGGLALLIHRMVFYFDHDILQNLEVVDSPGTGSRNRHHSTIAVDLMKKAHAIVMMTEATTPLERKDENEFLEAILREKRQLTNSKSNNLFIIANKLDLSEKTLDVVIAAVQKKLEEQFEGDIKTPHIFALSSLKGDGMKEFQNKLNRFLQEDKDKLFIQDTARIPESLIRPIIDGFNEEEDYAGETLKDVERQVKKFESRREEYREKLIRKVYDFDLILKNADRPEQAGGLGIREALSEIKDDLDKQVAITKEDSNAGKYGKFSSRIVSALKRYDEDKNETGMENSIARILNEFVQEIYQEVGKKVTALLDKQLKEAQEKFMVDLVDQVAGMKYDFKLYDIAAADIDMENAAKATYAWHGFASGSGAAILGGLGSALWFGGLGAPTVALLISTPVWTAVLLAGVVGAIIGWLRNQKPEIRASQILEEFVKAFSEKYETKDQNGEKVKQKSIRDSLHDQMKENIVKKRIDNIVSENKSIINDLIKRTEKQLKFKEQEKKKNEKYIKILENNRRMILKELETIHDDYKKLKHNVEEMYS